MAASSSIAKIIEVEGEGNTVEEAVESAVRGATRSVRNVKAVYVKDFEAVVENGSISHYRANCKITFVVDQGADVS